MRFRAGIAVGLLVLAACGQSAETTNREAQGGQFPTANPNTLVISSATDYFLDFRRNAITALDKYSQQPFVIKGVVKSVDAARYLEINGENQKLDPMVNSEIELKVDDDIHEVGAYLNDGIYARELKPGDYAVLVCTDVAQIPLNAPANCYPARETDWGDPALTSRVFRKEGMAALP